jgi:tetratricopeptide (TPR) repeat protein
MDTEKASSYLKLALERAPGDPDALHMMARIQSEVHGELDEAERLYKLALHYCPHHLDCLWSYGAFLQVVASGTAAIVAGLQHPCSTDARVRACASMCDHGSCAQMGWREDLHALTCTSARCRIFETTSLEHRHITHARWLQIPRT